MTSNALSSIHKPDMDLSDVLRRMSSEATALHAVGGPKTASYGQKISDLVDQAYDFYSFEEQMKESAQSDTHSMNREIQRCRDIFTPDSDSWAALNKQIKGAEPQYNVLCETLLQATIQAQSLAEIKNNMTRPYAKSLLRLADQGMLLVIRDLDKEMTKNEPIRILATEHCRDQFDPCSESWKLLDQQLETLVEDRKQSLASQRRAPRP